MSWAQHKKPATIITSSSLSATNPSSSSNTYVTTSSPPSPPSSSILSSNTLSSVNINNSSFYQPTNRNANSLRQACQTITNSTHSPPQTLLMTSQYSTKSTTALKSPPAANMRINATTPYQASAQQQLHQQQQPSSLSQRHHPQQLQQHQINNALQQPTSQVSTQTVAAYSNTTSQMQGVFNNNAQQQQNSWPTQQNLNYFPSPKNMQPTPPPPINTTATTIGSANNWPQQTPQHVQENYQNVNMFQQNVPPSQQQQQQQQQWPLNTAPPSTYDNYYQQQTVNNNMYPQQQLAQAQQHAAQQNPSTYFQQHPPQTNAVNFFDHTLNNNNNQAENTDGWGDWDWNENTALSAQPAIEQTAETNKQALPQTSYNTSLLADSFNTQNNNDSWNWDGKENDQQVSNKEVTKLDNASKQVTQRNDDKENQQQQISLQQPLLHDKQHDNWSWQQKALNENQQQVNLAQNVSEISMVNAKPFQAESSPPPPPPPVEFSSATPENHNYNTNASATTSPNNIPNTVFVTQAKPVTLPSRQYASPPGGNTPVIENPPETALMPPQGFQNIEDIKPTPAILVPPPAIATTSVANLPPPTGLPTASTKTGNPFKRSGMAQHHRATGLLASTATQESTVFQMPPPPPADFANPGTVTVMEPENNELPAQENQEVLLPTNTQITLPSANLQPAPAVTQGPPPPPPPNDERNQYLQTSHLSENSEEQQPEIDGLLPPPGLSRLVLGEPELEASQQRMVMGTEASNVDNAVSQAAVMHLEERHADGEDTASENAVPVTISSGQGVPSTSSTLSSDRNLYMVPGESTNAHNSNQQRVVTGVELAEQREIEMDGENLEDEQQQQQQQHAQHQHAHSTLSSEARNEPPVEGADDTNAATGSNLTSINMSHTTDQQEIEQHHHSSNQLTKLKESNAISSPNEDDDSDDRLLNDRGMNQSTAGSSKSRTKYGNERLLIVNRRRDKRSSVDRYDSDEYFNSEGEYSSEREERERRERDRRRNYREGSVRSDRGVNEDDEKRSRRQRAGNKRDKYYYDEEERNRGSREERERERIVERSKTDRRSQRQRGYDNDSRYETEESTRFDSRKDPLRRSTRRNERIDQPADFDDYNRRGAYRSSKRPVDNYESDRRDRRRSDKHREPRFDPREYEDYRKHSSRNARESDMEKETGAATSSRSGRMHHDPRHAAAMYGYPSGGYYDPYTAYYYQQMARTNPQAYAEWYKKYYGQAAATGVSQIGGAPGAPNADTSLTTSVNDGRESVHSGRSSAHNDIKDRYTHAYITQANDYHRHYQQQHQLHQQHFHQQQQQQMAFNQSLNSTMLDEENLNHNTSMYCSGGLGSLSLARSNTNLSQIHGGYYLPATGSSVAGVYYARSDYAESRSGAVSVRDQDALAQEPQRLTPCKFITEHTVVNFASGILVTVKPKFTSNGSISNIVKLLKFKPNDETRKLFKVFPGPLVRGLTHKKTVIEFCQEQIRLGPLETTIYAKQLITNNAEKYRGSYTLMWNLLILLLKQNGMVVGTDIAELLLKNQQQFPYQTSTTTANTSSESKSGSNSHLEELNANKESLELTKPANQDLETLPEDTVNAQLEDNDLEDNSLTKSSSNSISLNEEEITEKFRNYLLYGNVNEALEWATDNNLWGHALFLASKLDRRSHANVMMKFANKLSLNDPLQTLYQLMSGRTPSSVTCVQDEKWGDWRPHLSMILSNTSQKPELDRKAITTLGDSLFNRGDLYAAHFCYLMAQVGFGRYPEMAAQETSLQQHLPKLVLLGSSHYKHFKDFAHNEAIIMTEIYEYACSLNDDKFSLVEFQPYKFLLATRLLDYGFHLKSLMYLEQIAVHIARDVSKYESSFINKVYELADRLKYYDPALEKTIDDQQAGSDDNAVENEINQQMEEQKWLQNLRHLAEQYKSVYNVTSTLPSTADAQDSQQPQLHEPVYYNQQQQIDQQFMEINKQFSELNLQYQQQQTMENVEQQQTIFYNTEQQQQQIDPYQQQQQEPVQSITNELPKQNATDSHLAENLTENYQQQSANYMQPELTQNASGFATNYYDHSQYNEAAAHNNLDNQQPSNYEYWSQQQQPLLNQAEQENSRPTISMPKTKTYDTDEDNSAKNLPQTGNEANKKQQQAQQQQQKGNKKEDANKNQQQGNQNSGWFGGIWNKFSLKPKNQMILPDDKNPSIVWDPEKKKWVNTDGDENEQEAFKPPPKMSDLMPQPQLQQQQQQQQQQQHLMFNQQQQTQQQLQTNQIPFMDPQQQQQQQQQPQMQQQFVPNTIPQSASSPNLQQQQQNLNQNQPQAPGPAKTPTLQSNMFKMQRNRTLKNAYVDVFNPSGAPVNKAVENILAPALPPSVVPQSGFFIPGGGTQTTEQQYQQQQQAQQQSTPQFYNPNQFTSGTGY